MLITLLITCIILLIAVIYFIYRGYILAGLLEDQIDYTNQIEELSEYMYRSIDHAHENLKRIDRLGAFEKDDESGTTFSLLKEVLTNLNEEFNGTQEEGE